MATKMRHIAITVMLLAVLSISVSSLFSFDNGQQAQAAEVQVETIPEPIYEFGLCVDSFKVVTAKIKPNQFLADILLKHHIPYPIIDKLVRETKEIFDVRKIRSGNTYHVFCSNDSLEKANYFVYQPNLVDYIVFEIGDSTVSAYKGAKEVTIREKTAYGTINSSLYQTLADANVSPKLAVELSNIYAWTIDFYRIQKGDGFKVVYEERVVDGEAIGIGKIIAANFSHWGEDYYAYSFAQNGQEDYFDEEGNSLRKAFLKAPLKFSRISSRFTLKRYHPVQKRNKPHYGTDYAAPKGTPIMAVGDGVIIASSYSKYNGNFVKVKHNSTVTTQYLHMNKRNCKVGDRVRQGDIIGYVGSTGLATGPHVCFRFWKNGKQVDHLKEKFPPSLPIEKQFKADYRKQKIELKNKLDLVGKENKEVIS
ncbi:MAG: peptidoglycan DD-metalloendopeptidase family protein [Flavobacteriales bacterium]|nr:peptidoglycan DD-metalloendopeptidase family protein [Flavobacteriales bacterium]